MINRFLPTTGDESIIKVVYGLDRKDNCIEVAQRFGTQVHLIQLGECRPVWLKLAVGRGKWGQMVESHNGAARLPREEVHNLIANMLDGSRWPMVLVDENLVLIWANQAAQQEFASAQSFLRVDTRLSLGSDAKDSQLRKFLGDCEGKEKIFTNQRSEDDLIIARCRSVPGDLDHQVYSLSFFRPSAKPKDIDPPFEDVFGLTQTEMRILSMLGEGSTADSIAKSFDVSIATVRKHISNAYAKMGVRSREELFARLKAYT